MDRQMYKPKFIFALGLFNLAVFILTTLFLPSAADTWSYDGPVSYYINSRTDWYIAFGVVVSTVLISWGVYLVTVSFQNQKPDE